MARNLWIQLMMMFSLCLCTSLGHTSDGTRTEITETMGAMSASPGEQIESLPEEDSTSEGNIESNMGWKRYKPVFSFPRNYPGPVTAVERISVDGRHVRPKIRIPEEIRRRMIRANVTVTGVSSNGRRRGPDPSHNRKLLGWSISDWFDTTDDTDDSSNGTLCIVPETSDRLLPASTSQRKFCNWHEIDGVVFGVLTIDIASKDSVNGFEVYVSDGSDCELNPWDAGFEFFSDASCYDGEYKSCKDYISTDNAPACYFVINWNTVSIPIRDSSQLWLRDIYNSHIKPIWELYDTISSGGGGGDRDGGNDGGDGADGRNV